MANNAKGFEKSFHQKLFYPGSKKRKNFGLLERPSLPPSVPQVSYKIFITGRVSAGKTFLASRLVGSEHSGTETTGIEVHHVYWPMKIGSRAMLFRLELWDAGEAASKRYNHIKPACCKSVDGVLICFAATNYDHWKELPELIASAAQPSEKAAIIAVSTRWDNLSDVVISEQDLKNFEIETSVPILKLPPLVEDDQEEFSSMAPLLNFICRELWERDQHLLLSGKERL